MSNLLQMIIGIYTITSCIYFFYYVSEHEPNWSLNFMTKIILGDPITWISSLGGLFFIIVIGLPVCLFIKLSDLSDLIFKIKEDKIEIINKNSID